MVANLALFAIAITTFGCSQGRRPEAVAAGPLRIMQGAKLDSALVEIGRLASSGKVKEAMRRHCGSVFVFEGTPSNSTSNFEYNPESMPKIMADGAAWCVDITVQKRPPPPYTGINYVCHVMREDVEAVKPLYYEDQPLLMARLVYVQDIVSDDHRTLRLDFVDLLPALSSSD